MGKETERWRRCGGEIDSQTQTEEKERESSQGTGIIF